MSTLDTVHLGVFFFSRGENIAARTLVLFWSVPVVVLRRCVYPMVDMILLVRTEWDRKAEIAEQTSWCCCNGLGRRDPRCWGLTENNQGKNSETTLLTGGSFQKWKLSNALEMNSPSALSAHSLKMSSGHLLHPLHRVDSLPPFIGSRQEEHGHPTPHW